jgi:hypothetical protein
MISMTARASTTRRSPRRHFGAWVVAISTAAIQTAIQPVRRHFPSVIGIAAPNSPAGGGANNSGSRCTAHTSHRPCAAKPGGCESVACSGDTGNKFNVCWAGLGACSGIFSRRSSHGVRADRYTARDVAPVVTRGNQFNADRATVSPIGDQARLSRGRRPISPAFRSEIRATGSVRLSGDSDYQRRFTPVACARHLRDSSDRQAAAIEQLHVLMRQLAPVMEAAGLTQAQAGKRSR